MNDILLHTCCAPCSAAIIEWLVQNNIRPTLFYYNPNIYPTEEYLIRKNECSKYAARLGITMIDGDYKHEEWKIRIAGMENEPERGKRCLQCFKMRLLQTGKLAHENNFKFFATTLASSRWKDLKQINEAGNWAASQFPDLTFYEKNWRQGGLQERRNYLLKENQFYNQIYCGCEFSMNRYQSHQVVTTLNN